VFVLLGTGFSLQYVFLVDLHVYFWMKYVFEAF